VVPFFFASCFCLMFASKFWKSQWTNFWDWLTELWGDNCRQVPYGTAHICQCLNRLVTHLTTIVAQNVYDSAGGFGVAILNRPLASTAPTVLRARPPLPLKTSTIRSSRIGLMVISRCGRICHCPNSPFVLRAVVPHRLPDWCSASMRSWQHQEAAALPHELARSRQQ
jgi:hypothetical protein